MFQQWAIPWDNLDRQNLILNPVMAEGSIESASLGVGSGKLFLARGR